MIVVSDSRRTKYVLLLCSVVKQQRGIMCCRCARCAVEYAKLWWCVARGRQRSVVEREREGSRNESSSGSQIADWGPGTIRSCVCKASCGEVISIFGCLSEYEYARKKRPASTVAAVSKKGWHSRNSVKEE